MKNSALGQSSLSYAVMLAVAAGIIWLSIYFSPVVIALFRGLVGIGG